MCNIVGNKSMILLSYMMYTISSQRPVHEHNNPTSLSYKYIL